MKIRPLILSSLLVISHVVYGATVEGTNLIGGGLDGTDVFVTSSDLTPIPTGTGIASIGYFPNLTDQAIATTGLSGVTQLVSEFKTLKSDQFTFAGLAIDGAYFAGGQYVQEGDATGKSIYTFIGNGQSLEQSTEFLLFRHNQIIDGTDSPTMPESDAVNLVLTDGSLIFGLEGPTIVVNATNIPGNGSPAYSTASVTLQAPDNNPAVPDPKVVSLTRTANLFQMMVEDLDPAKTYKLVRGTTLESFPTDVGATFTGAATHTFEDPNPPVGEAYYRVESVDAS